MWKGVPFSLSQFADCVPQHGLRIMLAQQRYGAPARREQSEWQKQEEREPELLSLTLLGKPVCCEIVE